MERLTTDKPVSEMGMLELAHNSCFKGSDGSAKYRDFDNCVDARFFARELMVKFGFWKEDYKEIEDDESFDWAMLEKLADVNVDDMDIEGLIVLFYRNLWAMAELRERLKQYEDAEEQGLLLRLPCKKGSTVWLLNNFDCLGKLLKQPKISESKFNHRLLDFVGKTVFLTKEEAEAALAKLESEV